LDTGAQADLAAVYLPQEWGVARGETIPVGTKLAKVSSEETFGLINSACNNVIPVEFEMQNATLDTSRVVAFRDSEADAGADPSVPGYGTADFAEDRDANGIIDAIDSNPDFLAVALGEVRPLARLAGVTPVAGLPVLLQFLVFPPGTRVPLPDPVATELIARSANPGYPMLIVLQDFRSEHGSRDPGPITDYCAPNETTISFAPPEQGAAFLVNPQAGLYQFSFRLLSKRDADGDAFDNSLDTCHFQPNAGNPAVPNDGDADGDGMDRACDPNDYPEQGGANSDQDGDGYLNRQDNCPLIENGQGDDLTGAFLEPPANQSDLDFDDIGDVCDPNRDDPNGESVVMGLEGEVVVGAPVAAIDSANRGPPSVEACPHCYRPGEEPTASQVQDEGSGNQLAVAIGLIALGAGAGAVVLGGGAAYLMRRRRS
jgi:hypothetical protein